MNSNVFKFLVKFAVLDIVATAISVGSVFGMENKEIKKPCPICLIEDLVDEEGNYKKQGVFCLRHFDANNKCYEHYFCNSCIKSWAKDKRNFCPLCRTTIRGVELGHIDDLVTHELTKEQNEAVETWNQKAKNIHERKKWSSYKYSCDLDTSTLIKKTDDYKENKTPFSSEDEFIDSGLGICHRCKYIMKRPEILDFTNREKTYYQESGKTCKICPCCGANNYSLKGRRKNYKGRWNNYKPHAYLTSLPLD